MSYELGAAEAYDLEEIGRLADRVFRSRRPGSMLAEYPLLFDPSNAGNLLIARDAATRRIVTHIGLCLRDAVILGAQFRVCCIGAVCTDPDHRGHGLATRLMEMARSHAVEQGASLMLISGDRGLYTRLGYVEVGDFLQWELPAAQPESPAPMEIAVATVDDLSAVIRLHEQEPVRFMRPRRDWDRILNAGMLMNQTSDLYVARRAGGAVAYLAVQRDIATGPNGQQMVRVQEVGGSRSAIRHAAPVIAALLGGDSVRLTTQASDAGWNDVAAEAGCGTPAAMHGTVGILDGRLFADAVAPLLAERAPGVSLDPDGDRIALRIGDASVSMRLFPDFTKLVFAGPAAMALPPAIAEAARQAFPLPLLWYGYNYV